MNKVLGWIKSNLYTVVFVVILLAAPAAMWFVSGKMNASVREEVERRAGRISELGRLEKTSVKLSNPVPGNQPVNASVVVNRKLLDRYREVVEEISADAEQVRAKVLEINRKGRSVLLPELFPEPAEHQRETLPVDMYLALQSAYEQLLTDIGAGAPPSLESTREELEKAEARSRTQILMKEDRESLTEEEQAWLSEQMTKTRLAHYADTARQLHLYVTLDELNVPLEGDTPHRAEGDGMLQMFGWQWDFWTIEDILRALSDANDPYGSVVEAPVKRVVSLTIYGETVSAADESSSSGGGGGGGTGFGAGAGGGRKKESRKPSGGSQAAAPNPSREVPLDFTVSLTGRKTNPLYDVRYVRLALIVDSARIPEVFDALANWNFITVIDAEIESVNLYEAAAQGYFYGGSAVSLVTFDLETIWIREWTTQFMPDELKLALGIPIPKKTSG